MKIAVGTMYRVYRVLQRFLVSPIQTLRNLEILAYRIQDHKVHQLLYLFSSTGNKSMSVATDDTELPAVPR